MIFFLSLFSAAFEQSTGMLDSSPASQRERMEQNDVDRTNNDGGDTDKGQQLKHSNKIEITLKI